MAKRKPKKEQVKKPTPKKGEATTQGDPPPTGGPTPGPK